MSPSPGTGAWCQPRVSPPAPQRRLATDRHRKPPETVRIKTHQQLDRPESDLNTDREREREGGRKVESRGFCRNTEHERRICTNRECVCVFLSLNECVLPWPLMREAASLINGSRQTSVERGRGFIK